MFLTVVIVWLGLSLLASVVVLAAVVRAGQIEQMAEDEPTAKDLLHCKSDLVHSPPNSQLPNIDVDIRMPMPEQERGLPIQASNFTSDNDLA